MKRARGDAHRPQITERCSSGANESHFISQCSQGIMEEAGVPLPSLNGLHKYASVCQGRVCDCTAIALQRY